MKKLLRTLLVLVILAGGFLVVLKTTNRIKINQILPVQPEQTGLIQTGLIEITGDATYLGSDYSGNYVRGAAMNLAWNELNENILHEKLQLNTTDAIALSMVQSLNTSPFTKNDLDEPSYYIKSGYGQATVDAINKESKEKFPSKSFGDLTLTLNPEDIVSYAYFLKEVEYVTGFKNRDVPFDGQIVKGFYAKGQAQKKNIKIITYENDDKFIISLQLKDQGDQMILAKGYAMDTPEDIVNQINKSDINTLSYIDEKDAFMAPQLHLDHHRDYTELLNKFLANKGWEKYVIAKMFENIKFDMDENGARVENEGVIGMEATSAGGPEPKIKQFILDKPYRVIMKRSTSQNPYFILGVKNTTLMNLISTSN